jgi:hypothetical protein
MIPALVRYDVFERRLAALKGEPGDNVPPPPPEPPEATYFRENIRLVSSEDDLLSDFRLYRFALTAFDLGDSLETRAIVRRALEDGVREQDDFANRWPDGRYRELARAFGFAEVGVTNVISDGFADFVVAKYQEVTLETQAGVDDPSVRLAAFFKRNADGINNWFSVIGSGALREVVMTTLRVPEGVQRQDIDSLADYLEREYDIADFQDPEKVDEFVRRYLVLNSIETGPSTPTSSALTLLAGARTGGNISLRL